MKEPVLIDLGDAAQAERSRPALIEDLPPAPSPADAPPIDDDGTVPTGAAMRTLATLGAQRPSRLGRWAWRLGGALVALLAGIAFWEIVASLMVQYEWLGWLVLAVGALFVLVMLAIAIREWAAFARLGKLDALHRDAEAALAGADLKGARSVATRLAALYDGRDGLRGEAADLRARASEIMDADGLLAHAETQLLTPLDALAVAEVEAAARQVATVTAIVPLAFADIAAALTSNLRMIRRIAEVYGGRSGRLGTWRLARAVMTHLVATGAVAVGDDLIHSVAGGSILTRVSRRFGEGIVNGALTARVGVAAMEVCRPLPFRARPRPSVTALLGRAFAGLFSGIGGRGDRGGGDQPR